MDHPAHGFGFTPVRAAQGMIAGGSFPFCKKPTLQIMNDGVIFSMDREEPARL